jgi:hypothetical protein
VEGPRPAAAGQTSGSTIARDSFSVTLLETSPHSAPIDTEGFAAAELAEEPAPVTEVHPQIRWLQTSADTLGRALRRRARLLVCIGLAIAGLSALACTARSVPVNPGWAEERLATPDEDIHRIYFAAARASWSDAPGWFTGNWISPGIGYYRPLTSVLFLAEHRAFGRDFVAYNRVTWLLHAANTCLLFLLTVSLFRERPVTKTLFGLIAVLFFTTDRNSFFISVGYSINWWPAQNDVLSLTFGLLSLLLLDQYLVAGRRTWLAGALIAFACSVGSKEMGYAVLPVALALIAHRKRSLSVSMAGFVLLAGLLWILRKMVVTNPWGQNFFTPWVARKAATYWGGPFFLLIGSGTWWPVLAAPLVIAVGWWGLRRRWPIVCILALMIAAILLSSRFIGQMGEWVLVAEGLGAYLFSRAVAYLLAPLLFWKYRRSEPGLFAMCAYLVVFIPILQFVGIHYLYWPGAFLALADACFCAALLRFGLEAASTANWTVPGWRRLFTDEAAATRTQNDSRNAASP